MVNAVLRRQDLRSKYLLERLHFMNTKNTASWGKSLAYKAALMAVISLCLVLGVIGLILPILPGIVFLVVAVMLAGKLSNRVANWANKFSLFKHWTKRSSAIAELSIAQQLKLAFWLTAKHTVNLFSTIASWLTRQAKSL